MQSDIGGNAFSTHTHGCTRLFNLCLKSKRFKDMRGKMLTHTSAVCLGVHVCICESGSVHVHECAHKTKHVTGSKLDVPVE